MKQIYYEEWKAKDPEAAQRAWYQVQAYDARVKANRLKREQEAERIRLKKLAKSQKKSAGAGLAVDFDKLIVHFSSDGSSFLTDLQDSRCDVRTITEISSRKGLKDAYHKLGSVSHSTLLWLTLPFKSAGSASNFMSDEQFWRNLAKVMRYVRKGSGRIVFHMPRKSKSWQHEGVKAVFDWPE